MSYKGENHNVIRIC